MGRRKASETTPPEPKEAQEESPVSTDVPEEETPEKMEKRPPFEVSGRPILGRNEVFADGQEIKAKDLNGGEKVLSRLVKKGRVKKN